MDSNILARIKRMHAAFGRVVERDFAKLPARITRKEKVVAIHQDFSGGQTEDQMSEALHSLIAGAASFHDHLKKWARAHGVSTESAHNYLAHSFDFCVVFDLWNLDKHGGAPRDGGWSRKSPRLLNVRRVMQLSMGPHANSTSFLTFARNGTPVVGGDGDGRAVLTGEVVDRLGNGLGDAHRFLEVSVRLCESAIRHFGVDDGQAPSPTSD